MATNFFRTFVNDYSFIRGAARLLFANITQPFPDEISDVIALQATTGSDDVQTIHSGTGTPTAGTFTLSVDTNDGTGRHLTAGIVFNASAAAVQAALQALPNVGAGNVACSGGALPANPVVATFQGALANESIADITVDSTGLTGGTVAATHTTPGTPTRKLYDAQSGWFEAGSTKTGITIGLNNSEEQFTIDQQLAIIGSEPTGWTCTVGTALAESTPERMQLVWQGSEITVNNTTRSNVPEKQIGFGAPNFYIQRRMAVLFKRPSDRIRAYCFRIIQRAPQESSIVHAPTGDQQSIPALFNALADTEIDDTQKQLFMIYDQAVS